MTYETSFPVTYKLTVKHEFPMGARLRLKGHTSNAVWVVQDIELRDDSKTAFYVLDLGRPVTVVWAEENMELVPEPEVTFTLTPDETNEVMTLVIRGYGAQRYPDLYRKNSQHNDRSRNNEDDPNNYEAG